MRVYLDHVATAPVRPDALAAYLDAIERVGNPSSVHADGRAARETVESARAAIADALGADAVEVVLTSGGTESVNLGIQGMYRARRDADPRRTGIVTTRAEHSATLDTVAWLAAHERAEPLFVDVERDGVLALDRLGDVLRERADEIALVTSLWVNNEVGAVQPIGELSAAARAHGIPIHLDAVAAVGRVPVSLGPAGADALSLSGHKLGAPHGSGALLVRRDARLEPILHGGAQQRIRSGTEDPAGAAALAAAVTASVAELPDAGPRMARLRDRLVAETLERVPGVTLHGPVDAAPGIANLGVEGAEGESLLYLLDAAGISVSTGAACRAGVAEPSHVLLAMGRDEHEARGALRITLGPASTDADVDAFLDALPAAAATARHAYSASDRR